MWWAELALEWWIAARVGLDLADLPQPSANVSLSVVVPARNEEKNIEQALGSLLKALPEGGEVLLVNDRSTDGTGVIAHRLASQDARLKVMDITKVPEGWLGKTHAMQAGYSVTTGEFILFTDADVVFQPGCLARAVQFCKSEGIDHLVATPLMVTKSFWERVFVLHFAILLMSRFRIWRASIQGSSFFAGIGAFNLVRRTAYEKAGTHSAIKGEVVDDLLLGRLIKRSGGKQYVVSGERCLQVRWHEGLGGLIKGLEKNAFAGFDYSPVLTVIGCIALILITAVPGLLPFLHVILPESGINIPSVAAGAGVWVSFAFLYALASRGMGVSRFYFLTFPAGTILLVWTIIRSLVLYYVHGGVKWRGTVYQRKEGGRK
ncbi:MAG: glycosyltransferase family 2 protein [bacterium]|nr:glycosyltransferase family 2 protein [bacterium]MDT8366114.1 glycosyltransferase family 2 protein [bacterium]